MIFTFSQIETLIFFSEIPEGEVQWGSLLAVVGLHLISYAVLKEIEKEISKMCVNNNQQLEDQCRYTEDENHRNDIKKWRKKKKKKKKTKINKTLVKAIADMVSHKIK